MVQTRNTNEAVHQMYESNTLELFPPRNQIYIIIPKHCIGVICGGLWVILLFMLKISIEENDFRRVFSSLSLTSFRSDFGCRARRIALHLSIYIFNADSHPTRLKNNNPSETPPYVDSYRVDNFWLSPTS